MIEKIISMLMVVIVIIFTGLLLYTSVFANMGSESDLVRKEYERDYADHLIESMLMSYDNESGMTYEVLLVKALTELSTVIEVEGVEVDVEERFSYVLDQLLGPNRYFFKIKPVPKGVSVSYVLDGSETMKPYRDAVRDSIGTMVTDLSGQDLFGDDASFYIHVYILREKDNEDPPYCQDFGAGVPQGVDVSCDVLDSESLYGYLRQRGFDGPIIAPYGSFEEWLNADHDATARYLSSSDWASGVAYASYQYDASDIEKLSTNVHIIVTAADEMTSSSKADECFNRKDPDFPDPTDNHEWHVCRLCDTDCPFSRAQNLTDQTARVIADNSDLFIGFYPFSTDPVQCNYDYNDAVFNNLWITEYICSWMDWGNQRCAGYQDGDDRITAQFNWCEESSCPNCRAPVLPEEQDPDAPCYPNCYCLFQGCNAYVLQHMDELASATGGTSMQLDNVDQLTDEIVQYFSSELTQFNFTIGYEDQTQDRYVVEKTMRLAAGKTVDMLFWVYE